MIINNNYRHELKYIITDSDYLNIKCVLNTLLEKDGHQGEDGYKIRSLYFDTEENRFLNETINGVDRRFKYRIRTYDGNYNLIKLEKKISENNKKMKIVEKINKNTVKSILNGNFKNKNSKLLQEIYVYIKEEGLSPKILVEYDRCAYISKMGNIRITLDKNIRTSSNINDFFGNPLMIPIMQANRNILEVKYDGILPGYIARELGMDNLERVSYSKYVECYRFLENNGREIESYEY